jgi:predicted transcriptional regulator
MNIKTKLKSKGIKISWVAKKVGISQPLLSMYLKGTRKMPEKIEAKINTLLK